MKKILIMFTILCVCTVHARVKNLQQKRYRLSIKNEKKEKGPRTKPLWHNDVGWTYDHKRPKWWPHGGAGYRRTPDITWGIKDRFDW